MEVCKLIQCIVPPQPWMDTPGIWTRSISFKWSPLTIYVVWPPRICSIITSTLVIICFQLISASMQARSLVGHIISPFPQHHQSCMCVRIPAHSYGFYHSRDKAWNMEEGETMEILSGDKVPLGDNRGTTRGKLYLRHNSVLLMYPLFLTSMLGSKRSTLIHLESFIKVIHQLWRYLHIS